MSALVLSVLFVMANVKGFAIKTYIEIYTKLIVFIKLTSAYLNQKEGFYRRHTVSFPLKKTLGILSKL